MPQMPAYSVFKELWLRATEARRSRRRVRPFSAATNKKPGVERRAKPPFLGGFARSSTDFYPVLVADLTKVPCA